MSVNAFDRTKLGTADELEVIATKGRNRTYIGTQAAVEAAMARGDIGNASVVYITDDYKEKNPDPMPIGTILPYVSSVAPAGYLTCDGSNYDTAKYPKLFAVLGRDKLPDLRSRFLMGSGARPEDKPSDTYGDEQLPNIKGRYAYATDYGADHYVTVITNPKVESITEGCFVKTGIHKVNSPTIVSTGPEWNGYDLGFDASEGETRKVWKDDVDGVPVKVRPDFYTVNYIIRAE